MLSNAYHDLLVSVKCEVSMYKYLIIDLTCVMRNHIHAKILYNAEDDTNELGILFGLFLFCFPLAVFLSL